MTNEEAIKHLTAKLECLTRSKGFREKCDSYNSYEGCYECDLGYKQGNIGEQTESLKTAIKALDQEPCEDCISREQAKVAIRDRFKDLPSRVEINTILNELPSVRLQPKTGHWIDKFGGEYRCSCCREIISIDTEIEFPNGITYKYCPNCGCRMKGVD